MTASLWHRPNVWLMVVALYSFFITVSLAYALYDGQLRLQECHGHSSCALGGGLQAILMIVGGGILSLSNAGAIGIVTRKYSGRWLILLGMIGIAIVFPIAVSPVQMIENFSSHYLSNYSSPMAFVLVFEGVAVAMIFVVISKWHDFPKITI